MLMHDVPVTTNPLANICRFTAPTHDLSLPLCLSKSRLPRESKPSPRPMPRPLPPRPPRPPPRPLGGLSPEGLRGHRRCSHISQQQQTHSDLVIAPGSLELIPPHSCGHPLTYPQRTLRPPQTCPRRAFRSGARGEVSAPASCLQVGLRPAHPDAGTPAGPAALVFGPPV